MKSLHHSLFWPGIVFAVLLLAVSVWGSLTGFWRGPRDPADSTPAESAEHMPDGSLVELPPGKLAKANIRMVLAETRPLQEWRTIPGRFQYNQTRHIALRAPTDGTLQDILVKPGDAVEPGALVATFQSPAIGTARAEVMQLEAQLALAARKRDWESQVANHTQELIEILSGESPMAEIENQFKARTLGQARETLFTAYARYHLADQMLSSTQSLQNSGAMSAKEILERTAARQTTEAAYRAAAEQAEFDSKQRAAEAEALYQNAQRQLQIGRQKLFALLGYEDKPTPGDSPEGLSKVEMRSPMKGTVEQILFASKERIAEKESLFVVADTKTLWVTAEIRDGDWEALNLRVGSSINVQVPAMPDELIKARVIYVGREVSEDTHALPLVAEIDNADARFRPGLFARVKIPLGQAVERLAVPSSALMQHEGKTFVFIQAEPGRFARVDVTTGIQSPEWVEVKSGLTGGEQVVKEGAFVLKSELLLEREE